MNLPTTASSPRKPPVRRWIVACAVAVGLLGAARGAEVDLTPISTADGAYTQVTVAGQNTSISRYLYRRRPNSFSFSVGQTLDVRANYYDDHGGRIITLQYDSQSDITITKRTGR